MGNNIKTTGSNPAVIIGTIISVAIVAFWAYEMHLSIKANKLTIKKYESEGLKS